MSYGAPWRRRRVSSLRGWRNCSGRPMRRATSPRPRRRRSLKPSRLKGLSRPFRSPYSAVSARGLEQAASLERRRRWAASGALPPSLAARFTLAETAVLAVVSAEVRRHGACTLTVGHIAALAGVSETTVRNAVREARALGLVQVEERRVSAWRNMPNRITVTSREWLSWLRLQPKGGGCTL